ncbi:MAG: DMT family transporter [Bacillota bacterium]
MFGLQIVSLLTAAAAGGLMAVQGSVNALLGKIIGLVEATFVVNVIGAVAAGILLLLYRSGGFSRLHHIPWFAWSGGVLGVLIIYGVAKSIPKVGVAPATTAIVVAQILTAAAIDHFGLLGMARLPFSGWRVMGGLLLGAGAWFLLRK